MEDILQSPVIFTEASQAFDVEFHAGLMSKEILPDFVLNHEELDLKAYYLPQAKYIFFFLLYYSKSFSVDFVFDLGNMLITFKQMAEDYSQEHISALLALHVFTSAKCISALKGKGKVQLITFLYQHSMFIHIFAAKGNSWKLFIFVYVYLFSLY